MPQKRSTKRDYGDGSVRPHGKSWIGRFHFEGKRPEPNLGKLADLTEKQAKQKLREYMATYKPSAKADEITMGVLCDKYIVHREADPDLAPSSLEAIKSRVRTHIKPEFGNRVAAKLTADDLERFQAAKLKVRSPQTVKHLMSVIHSILEYGIKSLKVLDSNVAKEVKSIKAEGSLDFTILSTEEIIKLCEAAKADETYGEQDAVMILMAARSGLRQGELISLRKRSLDFDNGWIRVLTNFDRVSKDHKRPKGKKFRALPMSDEVKAVLLPHVAGKEDNDLVFANPLTGLELDGSALLKRFKLAVIWAGIRKQDWVKKTYKTSRGNSKTVWFTPLTFHMLRHAFGTWCAMRGIPGYIIETWCGWADKETMAIYLHYAPAGFELELLNGPSASDPACPQIVPKAASATLN